MLLQLLQVHSAFVSSSKILHYQDHSRVCNTWYIIIQYQLLQISKKSYIILEFKIKYAWFK